MGIFSTKTTINVSSTVYNMAGDEQPRPDYLKSVIFSAIISPRQPDLAETIVSNFVNGPGNTQRRFFDWTVDQEYAGTPDAQIDKEFPVDPVIVAGEIPVPALPVGLIAQVTNAFITAGDFTPFTDRYVYKNYPALVGTNYLSEYFKETDEILISFEDNSTEFISAGSYTVRSKFLVAYYYLYKDTDDLDPVIGTKVENITDFGTVPSTAGFTLDDLSNTGMVTYAFADTSTEDFNTILRTYSKSEYLGGTGSGSTITRVTTMYVWERRYVVTGDHLEPMYDYQVDTQDTVSSGVHGDPLVYIYKIGGANATLNALATESALSADKEFYPLIPLRLDNTSIRADAYADSPTGNGLYKESKDAYRKMTGGKAKFDELIDQVEANEDLADIDFAYIQFGVSVNSFDNVAKKYMYRFFKKLMTFQSTDSVYMADFIDDVDNYTAAFGTYNSWVTAQTIPSDPLYSTPKPTLPIIKSPEVSVLRLQCSDPRTAASDMRISWVSILESTHGGLGKPTAKVGDVWFKKETPITYTLVQNGANVTNTIEVTSLFWQTSTGSHLKLTIYGMIHQNFIYGGKFIETSLHTGLDDTEDSGFLVPLHRPTMKLMGIKDATQLAMSNTYLVFNCYLVHKRRWYETFFGQLLLVLLIIAVSVLISPASFASAGGILGGNVAIGTTLGLSGITAVMAGAIANALASIVISQVVSVGARAVFGDKFGALIGSLLGFALNFGMSGGFQVNFLQNLFTPGNLLRLGDALAQGIQGYAQYAVAELNEESVQAKNDYDDKMRELQAKLNELGGNDLIFDPMQLTGASTGNGLGIGLYMPETADEFIQRTLMVGSDMYDLTLGFIENFSKISLTLPETD